MAINWAGAAGGALSGASGGGGGGGSETNALSTSLGPVGTSTWGNLSSGDGSSQGAATATSWMPIVAIAGIGLIVVLFALRR